MKCKNCGEELDFKAKKCKKCGISLEDTEKIQITYEDEEKDYVEPPVILEAHTFIDEESFAKKVNDMESKYHKKDKTFKPFLWILLLLIIIGGIFYFLILPNIVHDNNTRVEEEGFTSEEWTTGEFMLDDEFYKVNQPFSVYFKKGWSFDSKELDINSNLSSHEETDIIELYNSFHKDSTILVSFVNNTSKNCKIKDSLVWNIEVDNTKTDKGINFTLPGSITVGSKELEIMSIYGRVEEEFITRDDVAMSTTYHYSYNDHKNLDLVVYDNGGLKAFHYYFN